MTDPIADLLTRIKQGSRRFFEKVDMPASKLKVSILRILKAEGFISNYKIMEDGKKRPFVRVYPKYLPGKQEVFVGAKRVSKPGLRVYRPSSAFARRNAAGIVSIISTSKGLLTDRQASQAKVGGEILCQVW